MRWVLAIALCVVAGLGAASSFDLLGRIERAILYPFDSTYVSPSDAGLPNITEHIWDRDGVKLIVWSAPAQSTRPTIVYFHGNAGNLAARADRFRRFLDQGFGLLALSPRGAGGSGGSPSEDALSGDAADLLGLAQDWLPDLTPDTMVIYGESLGTGITIAALHRANPEPAGVILEAPFTSVIDIAASNDQIPDSLLPHIKDRWESLARVEVLTAPLLILHGRRDGVIPFAQGKALFDAAPSGRKQFIDVPQAGHSDVWRSDVIAKIFQFARNAVR